MEQVTSALKAGAMHDILLSRQELLLQQHYRGRRRDVGEQRMTDARSLPPQFGALEPFVAGWALASEAERLVKLTRSSIEELKAFYDAVFPRAEAMRAYLDQFRLDAMPDDAMRLFNLLLTFIETAHPSDSPGPPPTSTMRSRSSA